MQLNQSGNYPICLFPTNTIFIGLALSKANKDCNLTAGLEAKLTLAIGARVILRRNIDMKNGLDNGSIVSVTALTSKLNAITVKFDHIAEPYCVERVKSKFMLMKTFYVYQKQFPLILAYAVTIHKCKGFRWIQQ